MGHLSCRSTASFGFTDCGRRADEFCRKRRFLRTCSQGGTRDGYQRYETVGRIHVLYWTWLMPAEHERAC